MIRVPMDERGKQKGENMIILLRKSSDGNILIDTENVPEDLEEIVRNAFAEYTRGTAEEYMYEDKLAFIDLLVRRMHGKVNEADAVHDLMMDYFEDQIEQGEIPDKEEFLDMDFMEVCFTAGAASASLYDKGYTNDYHENRRVMQVLTQIIRTVMCYQAAHDGSQGGKA